LIDVKSIPGKGSTFSVYIPAAGTAAEKPVIAAVTGRARRGRILIMDDDEVVRTVAGELVRALGHDVDLAAHGNAAILKYKAAQEEGRPFDIVILDLTVRGGMGGVETVQKLREIDPEVKAVVSSGYSDDAVTWNYYELGFNAFLKKPYNMNDLKDALNSMFNLR
jgi:CheY-like chemotaxis protein